MITAAEVREWLDVADTDELVVSTVMSTADPSARWVTALFVPPDVAANDWPFAGASEAGKFHDVGNSWTGERTNLGIHGDGWLDPALGGHAHEIGTLPEASLPLLEASAPILVTPLAQSPLSALVYGVGRPIDGYWFPIEVDRPDPPSADDAWALTRRTGIATASAPDGTTPAQGLLVGRLRRSAWIASVRGGPDLDTFLVGIDADADTLSYGELVVELEEQVDEEVVQLRRLPLADVLVPAQAPNQRLVVALPTMGSRVRRRVRLWHSEGQLLDQTGLFSLVESISITLSIGEGVTTSAVGHSEPPQLLDRVDRARLVEGQYQQLVADAMPGRVVMTRADAEDRLEGALNAANGEVLVLDPYFGSDLTDWALLSAPSSARVLTGSQAKGPLPAHVSARKWTKGAPPWHDRLYIWDGGGLNVGTSPKGFGKRAFRIDVVSAAEAATWRSLFEAWWADPNAQPL